MGRGDGALALMAGAVLVVAGSDSSGGAGITRDVATLATLGLEASLAMTAVTVQTHAAVRHVEAVAAGLVGEQMQAALEAVPVGAVKIGMLPGADTILVVAAVLQRHPHLPVVVDPVLAASSGKALAAADGIALLRDRLFPLASLVTPNLPELARLSGREKAGSAPSALAQAEDLLSAGTRAVLVKGGHATNEVAAVDLLVRPSAAPHPFCLPRLAGSMRGTGCMLSTAIAAGLAEGRGLVHAIERAKTLVHREIAMAR